MSRTISRKTAESIVRQYTPFTAQSCADGSIRITSPKLFTVLDGEPTSITTAPALGLTDRLALAVAINVVLNTKA